MSDTHPISVETITEAEARDAHAALSDEIRSHNAAYYQDDAPVVSDAAYDALFARLIALEDAFPDLRTEDSPSQRVGAAPAQRICQGAPFDSMLSLGNAFDDDDVGEFLARIRRFLSIADDDPVEIVGEPKIDGLSVSLRYENGTLSRAPPGVMGPRAKTSQPT